MNVGLNNNAGFSPIIGLNTKVGEGQSLDVVRIRLAVLKLPYQHQALYRRALATYT